MFLLLLSNAFSSLLDVVKLHCEVLFLVIHVSQSLVFLALLLLFVSFLRLLYFFVFGLQILRIILLSHILEIQKVSLLRGLNTLGLAHFHVVVEHKQVDAFDALSELLDLAVVLVLDRLLFLHEPVIELDICSDIQLVVLISHESVKHVFPVSHVVQRDELLLEVLNLQAPCLVVHHPLLIAYIRRRSLGERASHQVGIQEGEVLSN